MKIKIILRYCKTDQKFSEFDLWITFHLHQKWYHLSAQLKKTKPHMKWTCLKWIHYSNPMLRSCIIYRQIRGFGKGREQFGNGKGKFLGKAHTYNHRRCIFIRQWQIQKFSLPGWLFLKRGTVQHQSWVMNIRHPPWVRLAIHTPDFRRCTQNTNLVISFSTYVWQQYDHKGHEGCHSWTPVGCTPIL